MNKRELEQAIRDEVAEWPGVTVEFEDGGKHPKAKLMFGDLVMRRPYAGTPSDSAHGIHKCLADMRRVMRQLGAERPKPEPTVEDIEKRYRKRNEEGVKARDLATSKPVEPSEPQKDMGDQLVEQGAATPAQRDAIQAEKSAATYERAATVRQAIPFAASDVEPATPPADRLLEMLEACGIKIVPVGEISVAAIIAEAVSMIEDGIYFDLPAEVYHAVPRLGSGSICDLIVSPGTFWRGSWLDPDRPELDEDATKAQIIGKAYHTARLEPEKFEALFCRELDKADFPAEGLLTSDAAVKAELKARGMTQSIGNESIVERAERLVDDGYEGTIWPLEKARWEAQLGGRTPIAAKVWDEIARDMDRLRGSPEIAAKLEGGAPEVSVFWTDRHGLKCKARFDYLRPDLWDDFKTFDNSRGTVLAQAIADAIRYNRIYVQCTHYRDAAEAIRTGGLQIMGRASDAERALIASIQIRPAELECWLIFQEKKGIPNLLGRRFMFHSIPIGREYEADAFAIDEEHAEAAKRAQMRRTGIFQLALAEIEHAKRQFALYSEVYPPGTPWAPIDPIGTIDDLDFNSYWLEGRG